MNKHFEQDTASEETTEEQRGSRVRVLGAALILGCLARLVLVDDVVGAIEHSGLRVEDLDPAFAIVSETDSLEAGRGGQGTPLSEEQLVYLEELENSTRFLAEQALEELLASEGQSCLPKICTQNPSHRETVERSSLLLATVPGSGNTMMRTILRSGTRVYTGSVYTDPELVQRGFKGEGLNPSRGKSYLVKTHYPFRTEPRSSRNRRFPPWANGAVHMLRSPLDAGLAECKRAYTGSHVDGMKPQRVINLCPEFITNSLPHWDAMMNFWEGSSQVQRRKTREYKGPLRIDLRPPTTLKPLGFPVASIWYEDVQKQPLSTLAYLFAFVRSIFPDDEVLPTVRESLLCVANDQRGGSLEVAHRLSIKHETPNIFVNRTLRTSKLGLRLCDHYQPYWNAFKWGPCNGTLQGHSDVALLPITFSASCPAGDPSQQGPVEERGDTFDHDLGP